MHVTLNPYYTLIIATIVLLVGRFLVRKIKFLRDFNIPEPVAGGLVAAVIIFIIYSSSGTTFTFDKDLQTAFMLVFFSSIGLGADFSKLKAGGWPLVVFLVIVSVFVLIQNLVGVGLAVVLGLDAITGLFTGSITLTGGHGTAAAWAEQLQHTYHIDNVLTLGVACATFGLVLGGLIGGPVARRLIRQLDIQELDEEEEAVLGGTRSRKEAVIASEQYETTEVEKKADEVPFEFPEKQRLITNSSAVETLALFAACIAFAKVMRAISVDWSFQLPEFLWALGAGVIIRNFLTIVFRIKMFDRSINVFGNASLSLFLAMALLSLKIWELAALAGPILIILAVQTIIMALYATFVTYTLMGRDYDAAVLAAGHCGFGMGATPTAVANMQAITDKYGASHKAFLIVPLVGAFFIDLINGVILSAMVYAIEVWHIFG